MTSHPSFLRLAALAALIVCATGCALRPTTEQLRTLGTVEITRIEVDEVTYSGTLPPEYEPDDGNNYFGSVFTMPIGVALNVINYRKNQARRDTQIERLLTEQCDVDLPSYFEKWFLQEYEKADLGPCVLTDQATEGTSVMTVDIRYGLENGNSFGESWTPWVELEAELWSADDERIWHCSRRVGQSNGPVRELPFPDPLNDAKFVRMNYRAAVHAASKKLLEDLQRNRR